MLIASLCALLGPKSLLCTSCCTSPERDGAVLINDEKSLWETKPHTHSLSSSNAAFTHESRRHLSRRVPMTQKKAQRVHHTKKALNILQQQCVSLKKTAYKEASLHMPCEKWASWEQAPAEFC